MDIINFNEDTRDIPSSPKLNCVLSKEYKLIRKYGKWAMKKKTVTELDNVIPFNKNK